MEPAVMTKAAALQAFFSGFGITAYPANAVPDETVFPWLTYEYSTGSIGDEVSITVHLYYHTTSESIPNAKAEEISEAIGMGGRLVSFDGGAVWIKKGSPFCTAQTDATRPEIKHRIINVTLEYLTA